MAKAKFNPATQMADPVRWFDALGKCHECSKPATGRLMGTMNDSYGAYCTPCANKRLDRAKAEQQAVREYIAAGRLD